MKVLRGSVLEVVNREMRIRQNPQTSLLADGAAVVRVDRLAVPIVHGKTQGLLRSEQVRVCYRHTRLHHLANGLGRDNSSPVWRFAPVEKDVRHREHLPSCRVDVASRAVHTRQGSHWRKLQGTGSRTLSQPGPGPLAIVVFAGIAVVLLDPVRVGKELTGRDFGADLGIGDLESGEVGPHRLVQADFPFVNE